MKRLVITLSILGLTALSLTEIQAQAKSSCDPKSCGPGDTKTEEAKAISTLRSDLQSVVVQLGKPGAGIDAQITSIEIPRGNTDDESLLYIYHAAFSIHNELVSKLKPDQLLSGLKVNSLAPSANKQQLVSGLKKEIELLKEQAERL